jgi:anti-sigma factor RsiW
MGLWTDAGRPSTALLAQLSPCDGRDDWSRDITLCMHAYLDGLSEGLIFGWMDRRIARMDRYAILMARDTQMSNRRQYRLRYASAPAPARRDLPRFGKQGPTR